MDQDFLSLVVSDVTDGEQLPEGARVVTGFSGDLVVMDHGGFEVSNAVVDELEDELHGGHGELVVFRQVVLVHWLLPGEGRGARNGCIVCQGQYSSNDLNDSLLVCSFCRQNIGE